MRKMRVSAAFRAACTVPALPEAAASGDTRAARFAGLRAASRTVSTPISAPLASAIGLSPNRGSAPKKPGAEARRISHSAHTTAVPASSPAGTAVRHQLRASWRTNLRTCFGVAPRHRSRPKNSVRCAMLLFRLPVIISTPDTVTSADSTAAAEYSIRMKGASLCPERASSLGFVPTDSSARPNCCWISRVAR